MGSENDSTMSFSTADVQKELEAGSGHISNDQIGLEREDVLIREVIKVTLEKFGLQGANSFAFKDETGNQYEVEIISPSHVKIGNKICVTLLVQDNKTDVGYFVALGNENRNWYSEKTIEKSDIISVSDAKETSRMKIVNMALVIRDMILPVLQVGDKIVTKLRNTERELGYKTSEGNFVFIRKSDDAEHLIEKPISLPELQKKAPAIKQVLRLTGDIGDDGELEYQVMDFGVEKISE